MTIGATALRNLDMHFWHGTSSPRQIGSALALDHSQTEQPARDKRRKLTADSPVKPGRPSGDHHETTISLLFEQSAIPQTRGCN